MQWIRADNEPDRKEQESAPVRHEHVIDRGAQRRNAWGPTAECKADRFEGEFPSRRRPWRGVATRRATSAPGSSSSPRRGSKKTPRELRRGTAQSLRAPPPHVGRQRECPRARGEPCKRSAAITNSAQAAPRLMTSVIARARLRRLGEESLQQRLGDDRCAARRRDAVVVVGDGGLESRRSRSPGVPSGAVMVIDPPVAVAPGHRERNGVVALHVARMHGRARQAFDGRQHRGDDILEEPVCEKPPFGSVV